MSLSENMILLFLSTRSMQVCSCISVSCKVQCRFQWQVASAKCQVPSVRCQVQSAKCQCQQVPLCMCLRVCVSVCVCLCLQICSACSRSVSGLLLFIFLSMAFTPQLPALLPTTTPFYLLCYVEGLGLRFGSVFIRQIESNWRGQNLVPLKMKVNVILFEYVCLFSNSPCKHRLCRHCSHFSWSLGCLFLYQCALVSAGNSYSQTGADIFCIRHNLQLALQLAFGSRLTYIRVCVPPKNSTSLQWIVLTNKLLSPQSKQQCIVNAWWPQKIW